MGGKINKGAKNIMKTSFDRTVVVSETGIDLQKTTLLSLRSSKKVLTAKDRIDKPSPKTTGRPRTNRPALITPIL